MEKLEDPLDILAQYSLNNFKISSKMKIMDYPVCERPRERLISSGPENLTDAEIIALILGTGTCGANAIDIARTLLEQPIAALANYGIHSLMKKCGIGTAKACRLQAAFELAKRLEQKRTIGKVQYSEIVEVIKRRLRHAQNEQCLCVFLDARENFLLDEIIFVGTLNATIIHPREILRKALHCSAANIILAHNHPSGIAMPSEEDLKITARMKEAGKIVGINIMDHIIVGGENAYSILEERML